MITFIFSMKSEQEEVRGNEGARKSASLGKKGTRGEQHSRKIGGGSGMECLAGPQGH